MHLYFYFAQAEVERTYWVFYVIGAIFVFFLPSTVAAVGPDDHMVYC